MNGKRKIKRMLDEYNNNSFAILIQGLLSKEILKSVDYKKAKEENRERALKLIQDLKTNKNKLIPYDSELFAFRNELDYVSSKIFKKTDYKAEFIRIISEVHYTLKEEAFYLCKIQFHFGFDTEQIKAIIFKDDLEDLNEGDRVLIGISMAYKKSYFQIKKDKLFMENNNKLQDTDANEILRYNDISLVANARFITKRYFQNFYLEENKIEAIKNLLNERIEAYRNVGLELSDQLYDEAIDCYDNLPNLIFLLTLFETLDNDELYGAYLQSKNGIYKIFLEEYNKYAPDEKKIIMSLDDIHNETNRIMIALHLYK